MITTYQGFLFELKHDWSVRPGCLDDDCLQVVADGYCVNGDCSHHGDQTVGTGK